MKYKFCYNLEIQIISKPNLRPSTAPWIGNDEMSLAATLHTIEIKLNWNFKILKSKFIRNWFENYVNLSEFYIFVFIKSVSGDVEWSDASFYVSYQSPGIRSLEYMHGLENLERGMWNSIIRFVLYWCLQTKHNKLLLNCFWSGQTSIDLILFI